MSYNENLNRKYCAHTQNYSLQKTVECGQIFRWEKLGENSYLIYSRDTYCVATQEGNVVRLETFGENTERHWPLMLSLHEKDDVLAQVMSATPFLREAYDFSKGIRIIRQDPWEALATFILSQRNNIPRIKQCIEKVCWAAGRRLGHERYGFPSADMIRPYNLINCGLGYREQYLYAAAEKVRSGDLNLNHLLRNHASYQTALNELTALYGVGHKVAKCVMLFGLMHDDAFPVDIWIERAMHEGNITSDDIASFGKQAGLVQQHIYYYMTHRERR